jgi:hypothetical protein
MKFRLPYDSLANVPQFKFTSRQYHIIIELRNYNDVGCWILFLTQFA